MQGEPNLCLIVRDRYKFSPDMQTFDMTCPWDKHIFNRKNTETVENWPHITVELKFIL